MAKKSKRKVWRPKDKPVEGKILAVDLDGVCVDFYGRMREIAAEWLERPISELTTEVSYGLPAWGIDAKREYTSLHRYAVTQKALFETVPMIPGARRYLRKLSDEGIRIRIVTHRLFIRFFHNLAVSQAIGWLDRHGIPYWDLCFMKDKAQVGADIYVEDTPVNIEMLRGSNIPTICFANSTNVGVTDPRAKSWAEVYESVHEMCRT